MLPDTVSTGSQGRAFNRLTATIWNGGRVIAGTPFWNATQAIDTRDRITLVGSRAPSVTAPVGDHEFSNPLLAATLDSRLHLLWSGTDESSSSPSGVGSFSDTHGVWAASTTNGASWEPPVRLIRGPVWWDRSVTDVEARDGDRVFVAALLPTSVATLEYREGRWLVHQSPGRFAPVAVSLAAASGVLVRAFLGSSPPSPDRNSVFVERSPDGGASWSPPQVLQLSGELPASEVRVRASADGTFHVVWLQLAAPAPVIRYRRSRDRGLSWEEMPDLAVAENARAISSIVDQGGRLVVTFRASEAGESARLFCAGFLGGWSATRPALEDLFVIDYVLLTSSRAPLEVATLSKPVGDARAPFVVRHSMLANCS